MRAYQFMDFKTFYVATELAVKEKLFADAHTPIHHEELDELLHIKPKWVNAGYYAGGILGIIIGAVITLVPNMVTFPINIGGRPLFSWPAFSILMFELMVLFAALSAIAGFFFTQRYPRYDRPIFELKEYQDKEKGEYFLVTTNELRGVTAAHSYELS